MSVKKGVKITIVSIAVILLGMLLTAPSVLKNYINKHGMELTGRKLSIDKLRYNYFTSTARVINFTMFEKVDSNEFVGFDTLTINLKPLRLLTNEIYVQQFLVANPRGVVLHKDTVFNFGDLLLEDSTLNTEGDDATSVPYQYNLNQLEMRNGNFTYTDQQLDHSIHLKSISFKIPQIYWNATDHSKAGLDFELANGGHFTANMDYLVETGDFRGNMEVSDLQLKTFLPYLQQYMKISDMDGTLNGKISFAGSSEDMDQLSINGASFVKDVRIKDANSRNVLGGKKSTLEIKNIQPFKEVYEIEKMVLDSPYVYLALEDSLFNFEKMMVETDSVKEEEDSTLYDSEMVFKINHANINNGLIDFSDQRFREEFNYELSDVKLDMDTLELVDNWVNLEATMKLNERGKLEATLGLNPLNYMDSMQLDYVVTDFQLPDLNIYSKHYVGLPILFGDMYYVSKTSIANKQLESENELIIRNVDMGRKTGGLYDIPIKLALFILKDINGDITLDVPVKGDFDDPQTQIGPIIFNTLKNFMFKIVASPFKALGNVLGADSDEISHLDFSYTDTTLTGKQSKTLDLLLELEQKKPELQTDLMYYNDKELERLDAAREIAHKLYWKKTGKKPESNTKNYVKFLEEKTGKDSMVVQDYEVLIAPQLHVDSIIEFREKNRFEMVTAYLVNKNNLTSIQLIEYNPEEVLNKGSRPHFEVKVNLAEETQ